MYLEMVCVFILNEAQIIPPKILASTNLFVSTIRGTEAYMANTAASFHLVPGGMGPMELGVSSCGSFGGHFLNWPCSLF